jgi:uncharacterized beta-barrel protein YwiB (DUF1934 family)
MQRVLLNIKGTQREGDTNECIELITEGRLVNKPEGLFIEYDESELTGIEGCTTTLVLKDNCVTMERNGSLSMQMEFAPGRVFNSSLNTPYGTLNLHVFASRVESELNETEGRLRLEYELSMGSLSTFNKLDLSFKNMEDCIN